MTHQLARALAHEAGDLERFEADRYGLGDGTRQRYIDKAAIIEDQMQRHDGFVVVPLTRLAPTPAWLIRWRRFAWWWTRRRPIWLRGPAAWRARRMWKGDAC